MKEALRENFTRVNIKCYVSLMKVSKVFYVKILFLEIAHLAII